MKSLAELRESVRVDVGSEGEAEGENPLGRGGSEMSAESEYDGENHTNDTRNDPSTEEPEEIGTLVSQGEREENPTTGDGESASLESYGTCAVALHDYQVK